MAGSHPAQPSEQFKCFYKIRNAAAVNWEHFEASRSIVVVLSVFLGSTIVVFVFYAWEAFYKKNPLWLDECALSVICFARFLVSHLLTPEGSFTSEFALRILTLSNMWTWSRRNSRVEHARRGNNGHRVWTCREPEVFMFL